MHTRIVITEDGSMTLYNTDKNEHYHSVHGAVQESMHVFIRNGLMHVINHDLPGQLNILEIGFGSGLNALLTLREVLFADHELKVNYTGIEPFPVDIETASRLEYAAFLGVGYLQQAFIEMHKAGHLQPIRISERFTFTKIIRPFQECHFPENQFNIFSDSQFNLVYFDAFSPSTEPSLWQPEIFNKLHTIMAPSAVLTTYCSKGSVRRGLQAAGFKTERLPGPPGKFEMLRCEV